MQQICSKHGLTDFSDGGGRRPKCRKCSVDAVNKRRRKLKLMGIEYKGGCCSKCGYFRCPDALHFHHTDPSNKSFAISTSGNTRSWEEIKEELDKCVLLCANCHAEHHAD